MELQNGEFMSFVVRHAPFPDLSETLNKMQTLAPIPLSGAPASGEVIDGRIIIVGEVPADGKAFHLIEAGPITVSRALT
jgi:hypothetical protein